MRQTMRPQDKAFLTSLAAIAADGSSDRGIEPLRLAIFAKLQSWGVQPQGSVDLTAASRRINASFSTGIRLVNATKSPAELGGVGNVAKNNPALLQRHETRVKAMNDAKARAADDVAFIQALGATLGLPPSVDPPRDEASPPAIKDEPPLKDEQAVAAEVKDEPIATDGEATTQDGDDRPLGPLIGEYEARCFAAEQIDGHSVTTIGLLREWLVSGKELADADGIGPVRAAKIAVKIL